VFGFSVYFNIFPHTRNVYIPMMVNTIGLATLKIHNSMNSNYSFITMRLPLSLESTETMTIADLDQSFTSVARKDSVTIYHFQFTELC